MSSITFPPPESPPTVQDPSGSKRVFRPYTSADHHVTKGRYITSNDPRGYIPVYEYPLHGQWIMMDMDDGYVLWTGIWKALGHNKADIVKMVESEPDLASRIRRVRGGYLKIQGTWMPYEVALRLSRRVAWHIRFDLVPLFGPTFPTTCLSPEQPGFGQILSGDTRRRRARRVPLPPPAATANNWNVISATIPDRHSQHHIPGAEQKSIVRARRPSDHDIPISPRPSVLSRPSPTQERGVRYAPYQSPHHSSRVFSYTPYRHSESAAAPDTSSEGSRVQIAPIQPHSSRVSISLPSVSDMMGFSTTNTRETATSILERLKSDEADGPRRRSYPDYPQHSERPAPSTLSPFCPAPSQSRSSVSPEINTLPPLRVPVNDHVLLSSPTFSGSTSGDLSPSTPDCVTDRSPIIRSSDHWTAAPSQSDGPPVSNSKNHWPSVPVTTESTSCSDEFSPRLTSHIQSPVVSRPHRPW